MITLTVTNCLFAIFTLYAFFWLRVVVHELGHSFVAWLLDLQVTELSFGGCAKMLAFKNTELPIVMLGFNPFYGSCRFKWRGEETKWEQIALHLGGFAAEASIFVLFFVLIYSSAPPIVLLSLLVGMLYSVCTFIESAFHNGHDVSNVVVLLRGAE